MKFDLRRLSLSTGVLFLLLSTSACVRTEGRIIAETSEAIKESIQTNQESKTYQDWELAESHPRQIFEHFRELIEPAQQKALCDELKNLSGKELQVFEEEVQNDDNKELLSGCQKDLNLKLEDHHQTERAKMAASGMAVLEDQETQNQVTETPASQSISKTEIQYRDLSSGYMAVTGDVKPGQVILTFDDGPEAKSTPIVLKALRQAGAKATFFMLGSQVEKNPTLTQFIAEEGHAIGNHSYSHPYMGDLKACRSASCRSRWVNPETAMEQIRKTQQIIFDTVGMADPFFRFPYGAQVPVLRQFLKDNQMAEFFWNVDSLDWNMSYSNAQVMEMTMNQLHQRGKGIVLFHDIHRRTAEILPEFLKQIDQEGFQLVLLQAKSQDLKTMSPLLKSKVP